MDSPLKRFTATDKWDDKWFRVLSPQTKLLWLYLLDHCDNSGVVDPDLMLASFQIGDKVEEKNITELGDRVQTLPNGKLWIPKFIRFQFGALNPESRVHASVIKLLNQHNIQYPIDSLSIPYVNGMDTPKDKDKDKRKATLEEVRLACSKMGVCESDADWFWNKCEANGWTNGGKPIKSWTHTIASWKSAGYLPSQKPSFPGSGSKPRTKSIIEKDLERI